MTTNQSEVRHADGAIVVGAQGNRGRRTGKVTVALFGRRDAVKAGLTLTPDEAEMLATALLSAVAEATGRWRVVSQMVLDPAQHPPILSAEEAGDWFVGATGMATGAVPLTVHMIDGGRHLIPAHPGPGDDPEPEDEEPYDFYADDLAFDAARETGRI